MSLSYSAKAASRRDAGVQSPPQAATAASVLLMTVFLIFFCLFIADIWSKPCRLLLFLYCQPRSLSFNICQCGLLATSSSPLPCDLAQPGWLLVLCCCFFILCVLLTLRILGSECPTRFYCFSHQAITHIMSGFRWESFASFAGFSPDWQTRLEVACYHLLLVFFHVFCFCSDKHRKFFSTFLNNK